MPYIRDVLGTRDGLISGETVPGCAGDAIGALECAKLELYRRVAAPYEDTKIAENGDVYDPELLTEDDG